MRNMLRCSKEFFDTFFSKKRKNDYILTGLPRSGTSLLSALLCDSINSFCFNEIHYNCKTIDTFFDSMRLLIQEGKPVQNKITTDTQGNNSSSNIKEFIVDKNKINIGSKVNIPYLNNLEILLKFNLPILALVRNPVYTVGSWSSKKAEKIPEAHVLDEDIHERWKDFSFKNSEKIFRQAEIWEFYANKIYKFRNYIKIVRYEDLISDPQETIRQISNYIGITPPCFQLNIVNGNIDSKYSDIKYIRSVVECICKSRFYFQYH